MMANKTKRSVSSAACYQRYKVENRYYKNRMSDLIKHVMKNPNDILAKQALDAMERSSPEYRRNNRNKGKGIPEQKKFKNFPPPPVRKTIGEMLQELLG